jgi:hypothetical protein
MVMVMVGSVVGTGVTMVGSVVGTGVAVVGSVVGSGVGSVVGAVTGSRVTVVVGVGVSSPSALTGRTTSMHTIPRIAAIRKTEKNFFTISHPVQVHQENTLFIPCVSR